MLTSSKEGFVPIHIIMMDLDKLNQVWDEYIGHPRMLAALKSVSKHEVRIRKRLPASVSKLTNYQHALLENIFRCEAHRQKYTTLFTLFENDR